MPKIIICPECGEEKPHCAKGMCNACYYRLRRKENPEKPRIASQRWRERHPDSRRSYYAEHRAEAAAYNHRYYLENKGRKLAYNRLWRKRNPDYWRPWQEQHQEERAAYMHRWLQENHKKNALNEAHRRARKRALPDTLTIEQAAELLAIGQAIYPGQDLHLDHIMPISKGGGTTRANVHYIPRTLNFSKHNKLPQEIYKQINLEI